MSATTPLELQRLVAEAFGRQGWQYDLTVGRDLVAQIKRGDNIDTAALAQSLPPTFFDRNDTTRALVAAALERAIGGRILTAAEPTASIVINDHRYSVTLGKGAKLTRSNVNLGDGTQINVDVTATKDELLEAVEALLRAGLAGDWNDDAAQSLASVIADRADIDVNDVRELTTQVAVAEQPKQQRAKALLNKVALGGLGGALGTGISAGLGEAIQHLPL